MFPRLTQRLGTAVLDRVDVLVELSTLGEYGLAENGLPIASGAGSASVTPPAAEAPRSVKAPTPARQRDECPLSGASTPSRCDRPARP